MSPEPARVDGPFAVTLGLWQDRDPLEALHTAELADELGYSGLWIGEMATFDAFALATAVAQRTARITLTVGPLAVAVRDPVNLAMGIASVAALGGRPANLAIGSSSPLVVEAWHGRRRERTALHLREAITALRPLLAGERGEFDGTLVHTHGYRLRLAAPDSTLTVAAFGDRAVAVAGELAHRMVINLVTVEAAARLRTRLEAAARSAGRPPPRLAAWVPACVDPDADARVQLARGVVGYLGAPGYGEMFAAAGFGELVEFARTSPHPRDLLARVPETLARAVGLVGTVSEVAERARAYLAAGVDELCVVPATAGDPGGERTLRAISALDVSAR